MLDSQDTAARLRAAEGLLAETEGLLAGPERLVRWTWRPLQCSAAIH